MVSDVGNANDRNRKLILNSNELNQLTANFNLMTKYDLLIKKIHLWQKDSFYSTYNFSPQEKELIAEAVETIQVLEIIFKLRKEKKENHEPN